MCKVAGPSDPPSLGRKRFIFRVETGRFDFPAACEDAFYFCSCPSSPRRGPGEDPDYHFLKAIYDLEPISARILRVILKTNLFDLRNIRRLAALGKGGGLFRRKLKPPIWLVHRY